MDTDVAATLTEYVTVERFFCFTLAGVVRLMTVGRLRREVSDQLSHGFDAGHIPLDLECAVTRCTMIRGGQAMTAELEVIVDPGVGGEETLSVAG